MQPKANTPVETSQPSVALVSHQSSLQTSLLAHLISHELNIECPIVELSTFAQLNTTFALVDCQHHRREDLAKWLHDCQDCDDAPIIALFNVTPHSEHEDLLAWPCVHGLFHTTSSQELLLQGLNQLLSGEYWLPRRLLHHFLQSRRPPVFNPIAEKLTKRERQILTLIREGATNANIANMLFVSEHTVKSHLYNVYKKIGVKNRLEACNWARVHIPEN
ncbi:LuxR C-terminal-related transcriptional regulator [uncultured Pseudoteredinibacter sp.]|uniref:LuxR C-terminal-related transcriptional regulator n=1 Tax=uncultured Pseudoteredinibacter sp. TaxID=1641701 RepID=UPI00262C8D41|nr:LuxR C-terminal-related transcriptional regulator [uncultured Pseudoteredinibacter sp.]MCV6623007.1 LuxR C-terminal-related transcriptional regulator [Cellvibrionaceae bacterium]